MTEKPTYEELEERVKELEKEALELKRVGGALRESDEKHLAIIENIEEGYFEVDLAGTLTFVNDSMCKIAALSRDELLGMSNREYTTPKTAKKMYQFFNKVYRTGIPARLTDYEVIRKDGSIRVLEFSASLMRDHAGRPIGFRAIVRDISERKLAEEALKESEEKYRQVVEGTNNIGILVAKDAKPVFVNTAISDFLGYSKEELTSLPNPFDIIHPDDRKMVFERHMNRLTGKEAPEAYPYRVVTRDGSVRWVEVTGVQINWENSPATLNYFVDITDRKRTEEALRKNEEKYKRLYEKSRRAEEVYRSLLHSSADAIIIYDMEGKARYVSPAFTRIFGWTLEEVEGKQIPFLPESERDMTMSIVKGIIEEGTPCQGFETKRYTKDGRLPDVSISASRYYDHKGRPAGILVVLRDITQTRKLQSQLQHAQKMESIGTIASGVAHNFRNVLAGISVNSQLIEMKYQDNHHLNEIVERLNNSVKRGAALVDDLMQFSRKQSFGSFKSLDLTVVVMEICDLIKKSFDKRIEIRVDLPESIHVMGNYAGLAQVIMNLSTNAKDAMPNGGKLCIEVSSKEDQAEIIISDTGCGMD
ncbi:MAG: PAS domain S-box protein, partial [Deltaproteobacteria bacterium]|nr:PAS domain S-box protein [Deltaproteobacteria bacterium]